MAGDDSSWTDDAGPMDWVAQDRTPQVFFRARSGIGPMLRERCRAYSPAHVAIHPIAVLLPAGLLTDAADPLAPWREPCAQHVSDAMVARFGGAPARAAEIGRAHV